MTQTDLAEAASTTKQNIYKYENGIITNIPSDKIEAISAAMHTTPAYLMGWTEEREPVGQKDVALSDAVTLHRIPVLGRIAAGAPIYAEENIKGYTYTALNGGNEYFGLRVHGDSMNAAGIWDGYTVIVFWREQRRYFYEGQIAVCLIDGQDATLKRFSQEGNIVTLMPQSTNPEHKPFVFDITKTQVKILGLVVRAEFSLV